MKNQITLLLEQEDASLVKPTLFSATKMIEDIQIIMPFFSNDFEEELQFKTYSLEGKEVPNEFLKFIVPAGVAKKTSINNGNIGSLDAFLKEIYSEKDYFQLSFQKQEISSNKYLEIDPKCDLLANANSQCHQYFFVLQVTDFYFKQREKSDIDFYTFPKFYVIKSYYPFTQIFNDLFIFVRNLLESKRQMIFLSSLKVGKFQESFHRMNAENIIVEEQRIFQDCLEKFEGFEITSNYEASFSFKVESLNFSIKLPSKKQIPFALAFPGAKQILELFSHEEVLFLFLCILLEKTVIFVSRKKSKISNAINTFLCTIKPFSWVHPFVSFLPADCSVIVNSPLPMIIGIHMDSKQVFEKVLSKMDSTDDKIVVFLDEQVYYL